MSRCDLDLGPVDLESSWYVKRPWTACYMTKVARKFHKIRTVTINEGNLGSEAGLCPTLD